jgi:hypothetical protein
MNANGFLSGTKVSRTKCTNKYEVPWHGGHGTEPTLPTKKACRSRRLNAIPTSFDKALHRLTAVSRAPKWTPHYPTWTSRKLSMTATPTQHTPTTSAKTWISSSSCLGSLLGPAFTNGSRSPAHLVVWKRLFATKTFFPFRLMSVCSRSLVAHRVLHIELCTSLTICSEKRSNHQPPGYPILETDAPSRSSKLAHETMHALLPPHARRHRARATTLPIPSPP